MSKKNTYMLVGILGVAMIFLLIAGVTVGNPKSQPSPTPTEIPTPTVDSRSKLELDFVSPAKKVTIILSQSPSDMTSLASYFSLPLKVGAFASIDDMLNNGDADTIYRLDNLGGYFYVGSVGIFKIAQVDDNYLARQARSGFVCTKSDKLYYDINYIAYECVNDFTEGSYTNCYYKLTDGKYLGFIYHDTPVDSSLDACSELMDLKVDQINES